jgi:hypothetical protein
MKNTTKLYDGALRGKEFTTELAKLPEKDEEFIKISPQLKKDFESYLKKTDYEIEIYDKFWECFVFAFLYNSNRFKYLEKEKNKLKFTSKVWRAFTQISNTVYYWRCHPDGMHEEDKFLFE